MFARISFSRSQPDVFRLQLGFSSQEEAADSSSSPSAKSGEAGDAAGSAAVSQQQVVVEWTASEPDAEVLARVEAALRSPALVEESVRVHLGVGGGLLGGLVVRAAAFSRDVAVSFSIHASRPVLRSVELTRVGGSYGVVGTALGLALWSLLDVAAVTHLKARTGQEERKIPGRRRNLLPQVDDGAGASVWEERVLAAFTSLRELNASNSGLLVVPASVRALAGTLEELRVHHNRRAQRGAGTWACSCGAGFGVWGRGAGVGAIWPLGWGKPGGRALRLKMLPPELGLLTRLRVLAADSNEISILPGELRFCSQLEELTLENNRLTSVLLNFGCLPRLQVLHLYNNPLEFLPEISPCHQLRHLSVANLRVTADQNFAKFKVELLPLSSSSALAFFDSKHTDKLRPIFALMLRRSSGHHPLLAGALYSLAEEDPKNCELMAKQESGLTQVVLLALHDNPEVVVWACATLTLLAKQSPELAEAVVDNDLASVLDYIHPPLSRPASRRRGEAAAGPASPRPPAPDFTALSPEQQRLQLCSLQVLSAVAHTSPAAAAKLLTLQLLASLIGVVGSPGAGDPLRAAALEALGSLAWFPNSRRLILEQDDLMRLLDDLVGPAGPGLKLKTAATRVLALLGENEKVRHAVGRPPIAGRRGVRVLSLDGGGMKGIATVRMLRQLEARTGRHPADLFDLIVGTSTGGLLAVAMGLRRMSMDECEDIYKVLGRRVFSRPLAPADKQESWMESFYRTVSTKTQHVRAVVVGYRHDTRIYEALLHEYCDLSRQNRFLQGNCMIDTACLGGPKIALVSTLASASPARPFVFRNYELPPEADALRAEASARARRCEQRRRCRGAARAGAAARRATASPPLAACVTDGSSKHEVWQAVRASSAAATYLDAFSHAGERFQDGAVTANNPAVVALQEARLLWPDLPIEVVVSIGTGSSPPKRRSAALSTFMETGEPGTRRKQASRVASEQGSILIESSTSVDRSAEALAALLPLVPGLAYFRFCPYDPRCEMELDEIHPAEWGKLEAATDEYIEQAAAKFEEAAEALLRGLEPEGAGARTPTRQAAQQPVEQQPRAHAAAAGAAQLGSSVRLGRRRGLVAVHAPRELPGGAAAAAGEAVVDAVTAACLRLPECLEAIDLQAAAGSSSSGSGADSSLLAGPPVAAPEAAGSPVKRASSAADGTAEAAGAAGAAGVAPEASQVAAEEEGSSLGSYFSSWFGSPSKAPLASHPITVAADGGASLPATPAVSLVAEASLVRASSDGQQLQQQNQQQRAQQARVPPLRPVAAGASQSQQQAAPRTEQREEQQRRALEALRRGLEATADSAGLVHLGLEPAPEGLVLCWEQRVEAVVEPGEHAAALLARLAPAAPGPQPLASLSDLFDRQATFQLPVAGASGGGVPTVSLLSRHTQYVGGQRLSVFLLQTTEAAAVLAAEGVARLGPALAGRIVASAAALPLELVEVLLLEGGAKAVLCPPETAASGADGDGGGSRAPPASAAAAYAATAYSALLSGCSAAESLRRAGAQVEQQQGAPGQPSLVLHVASGGQAPPPGGPVTSQDILSVSAQNDTSAIAPLAARIASAYLAGGAQQKDVVTAMGDALAAPGECYQGSVANNSLPIIYNALQTAWAEAVKNASSCAKNTPLADFLTATLPPVDRNISYTGASLNATGPPPTSQQIQQQATADATALAQAAVAAVVAGQAQAQAQAWGAALDATSCLSGPVAKALTASYSALIDSFTYAIFNASSVCPTSRGFIIGNLLNFGIVASGRRLLKKHKHGQDLQAVPAAEGGSSPAVGAAGRRLLKKQHHHHGLAVPVAEATGRPAVSVAGRRLHAKSIRPAAAAAAADPVSAPAAEAAAGCCALLPANFPGGKRGGLPVIVVSLQGAPFSSIPKPQLETGVKAKIPATACTCASPDGRDLGATASQFSERGSHSAPDSRLSTPVPYCPDLVRAYSLSLDKSARFLGMPKGSSWSLYGPQNDTMGFHDWLGFHLYRQTGAWASRTQYAELFALRYPQDYLGLYLAMEHIAAGKDRVDVKPNKGSDVGGSFIVDNEHGKTKQNEVELPPLERSKIPYLAVQDYIEGYLRDFEAALFGGGAGAGNWRALANESSAIDYFLFEASGVCAARGREKILHPRRPQEIIKSNNNGYRGSQRLHRNASGPLMFGPPWDFNGKRRPDSLAPAPVPRLLRAGGRRRAAVPCHHAMPARSPADGFGQCCGFPIEGYENGGVSNGTSGGSAISPEASGLLLPGFGAGPSASASSPSAARTIPSRASRCGTAACGRQDPAFQASAARRFLQLRREVWTDAAVAQAVRGTQAAIHDAAMRTFAKWPVDFLNPYADPQPDAESQLQATVDKLIPWTTGRLAWMEAQFSAILTAASPGASPPQTRKAAHTVARNRFPPLSILRGPAVKPPVGAPIPTERAVAPACLQRLVLTTAHCIEELPDPETFEVVLNPQPLGGPDLPRAFVPQPVAISGYVWHEEYNNVTLDHDIALLLLSTTACAPTITLADELPAPGDKLSVVGWVDEQKLRDPLVTVIDEAVCAAVQLGRELPATGYICASSPPPASVLLWGSAGAPLIAASLSNSSAFVDTQYGVLAYGVAPAPGAANKPDVYISVADYLLWIQENSAYLLTHGAPSSTHVECM
eukprot:scaffold13.g219.t1